MIDGIKSYNVIASIEEDRVKVYSLLFKRNQYGGFSINGSLHKYFNEGMHNADDYTLSKLHHTLSSLNDNFQIDPKITTLNGFEFGVNIITEINPSDILQCFILHKCNSFERKAEYIQIEYDAYRLKIYDKSHLTKIEPYHSDNILRIEISVHKMRYFSKNDLEIKVLSDLLDKYVFEQLERLLVKAINESLVVSLTDETITTLSSDEKLVYYQYSSPIYWISLHANRQKFHKEKKRCDAFIEKHCTSNVKHQLIKKIKNKCAELRDADFERTYYPRYENTKFTVRNTSHRGYKDTVYRVTSLIAKEDKNTIKINSVFVSSTSKYYIHCIGCGRVIENPRKGQLYCNSKDVGKSQARKCRNQISKPRNKMTHELNKISSQPVLFDNTPYIHPDAKLFIERQKLLERYRNIFFPP